MIEEKVMDRNWYVQASYCCRRGLISPLYPDLQPKAPVTKEKMKRKIASTPIAARNAFNWWFESPSLTSSWKYFWLTRQMKDPAQAKMTKRFTKSHNRALIRPPYSKYVKKILFRIRNPFCYSIRTAALVAEVVSPWRKSRIGERGWWWVEGLQLPSMLQLLLSWSCQFDPDQFCTHFHQKCRWSFCWSLKWFCLHPQKWTFGAHNYLSATNHLRLPLQLPKSTRFTSQFQSNIRYYNS